jgi:hypothetical protein
MDRVNLYVVGVNKAGTSWLYYLLDSHPEVFMAEEKELYYFGSDYPEKQEAYHDHFLFDEAYRYFGEATPTYYQEARIAHQIHEYCPSAKVIAVVRDPIDRMLSQFYYHKQLGYIEEDVPVEAVTGPVARTFRRQSHYEETLPSFAETFGKEQFRVISLEEANRSLENSWKQLQQFLSLSSVPPPGVDNRPRNATGGRWFRLLYRTFVRPLKEKMPVLYRTMLRSSAAGMAKSSLLRWLGTNQKETPSPDVMDALQREFEPTYDYLEELGFDYYRTGNVGARPVDR